MKKLNEFVDQHFSKLALVILGAIFVNTCGNPNRVTNKRLEALTQQVDSLQNLVVTKEDLQIEGLKSEKRMIQATDRKMLDVQRQSEIDKEIQELSK